MHTILPLSASHWSDWMAAVREAARPRSALSERGVRHPESRWDVQAGISVINVWDSRSGSGNEM